MKRRHTKWRTRRQPPARLQFRLRYVLLVLLILLPTISVSSAQQSTTKAPPPPLTDAPLGGQGTGRVLVDGAKNPELIDRDHLVALILGSKAMPASPSEKEEQHLRLFARQVGLGREDTQTLRLEMIRLHADMAPIRARLQVRRTGVPLEDLSAFRQTRLQAYGRLLELLSADGRRKLDEYFDQQKRNARIVTGSQSR